MPKNLLLADDSKTIQQAVSMTFAREDVRLTTVGDGEAALRAAKASRPDLILADVSMPGLGGYELCQRVRADAAIKDVPVLLLGGGVPVDATRAQAVGASGLMPKPFDSGKLIEQVKQILANPRAAAPSAFAAARPPGPPVASRPPAPAVAPKPAAVPSAAGSTMMMSRPPPAAARPGVSAPPAGSRPPAPAAARPGAPSAPAARPSMPPVARPPLAGPPGARPPAPVARPAAPPAPGARPSTPPAPAAARPPAPSLKPPAPPVARPPPARPQPPPPPASVEVDEDIQMDEEEIGETPHVPTTLRSVPAPAASPKPSLTVVPPPAAKPAAQAPADGGEAHLRDALSKASREVIERIAWEVVPELAETIIREELERLIKERGT